MDEKENESLKKRASYLKKYKEVNQKHLEECRKEYQEKVKNKKLKIDEWDKRYKEAYEKAYGPLN